MSNLPTSMNSANGQFVFNGEFGQFIRFMAANNAMLRSIRQIDRDDGSARAALAWLELNMLLNQAQSFIAAHVHVSANSSTVNRAQISQILLNAETFLHQWSSFFLR